MKCSIDTQALENIIAKATTAAILASHIDEDIISAALTETIYEINRMVADLLGKRYVVQATGQAMPEGKPENDNTVNSVKLLRELMTRAHALTISARIQLIDIVKVDKVDGKHPLKRIEHLIDATSEAVVEAMGVTAHLVVKLATQRARS